MHLVAKSTSSATVPYCARSDTLWLRCASYSTRTVRVPLLETISPPAAMSYEYDSYTFCLTRAPGQTLCLALCAHFVPPLYEYEYCHVMDAAGTGHYCSPDSRCISHSFHAGLSLGAALALWQHRLSTWLHVSLSQQILRIYKPPAGILSAGF